jgi:hypothetical protein
MLWQQAKIGWVRCTEQLMCCHVLQRRHVAEPTDHHSCCKRATDVVPTRVGMNRSASQGCPDCHRRPHTRGVNRLRLRWFNQLVHDLTVLHCDSATWLSTRRIVS